MRLLRSLEKNASQFSAAFKSLKYLAPGSAGASRSFGVPYTLLPMLPSKTAALFSYGISLATKKSSTHSK